MQMRNMRGGVEKSFTDEVLACFRGDILERLANIREDNVLQAYNMGWLAGRFLTGISIMGRFFGSVIGAV